MQVLKGIFLKVLSVTIIVIMTSCIKVASQNVPTGQVVFYRSLFAIPIIFAWLASQGMLRTGLKTQNLMGHVWRGVIGTFAMGFTFAAVALLPLPEVTAIGYSAPILTVIFAAIFLGEKVGIFRIFAVALGMVGVLIILAPNFTLIGEDDVGATQALGALFMLLAAVFIATAQILIRKLMRTETTASIVFYFSITATIFSLATLPFGWVLPSWSDTGFLVAAGLLGGLGQICMTSAYRYADTSVVAPFEYTSMLLAVLIGYYIFSEVPTNSTLAGAVLVITAGVWIAVRESRVHLRAKKAKAP